MEKNKTKGLPFLLEEAPIKESKGHFRCMGFEVESSTNLEDISHLTVAPL